jgi:hypothetical protein
MEQSRGVNATRDARNVRRVKLRAARTEYAVEELSSALKEIVHVPS